MSDFAGASARRNRDLSGRRRPLPSADQRLRTLCTATDASGNQSTCQFPVTVSLEIRRH